jgi:hypothetical protein
MLHVTCTGFVHTISSIIVMTLLDFPTRGTYGNHQTRDPKVTDLLKPVGDIGAARVLVPCSVNRVTD